MLGFLSLAPTVLSSVSASLDTHHAETRVAPFLSEYPELPQILSQFMDLSSVGRLAQTARHLPRSLRQFTAKLELGVSGSAREYSDLDLGPCVRQYPRLRSLKISSRKVDLRSLAGLALLEELELDDVRFSHLGALTVLRNLKSLTLRNCIERSETDNTVPGSTTIPSTLGNLTNLESLTLQGTGITRLAEIANLQKLRTLSLSRNYSLENLTGLGQLKSLVELDLSTTKVSDLSELQTLPSLECLNLDFTLGRLPEQEQVRQMKLIMNLSSLKHLSLESMYPLTALEDRSLRFPKGLESLTFTNPPFTDFSLLAHLHKLKSLILYSRISDGPSNFTSATGLEHLVSLETLRWIQPIPLQSIPELKFLRNLKDLSLGGGIVSHVDDISSIAELVQLEKLSLRNTRVRDIGELKNLINLKELSLLGCKNIRTIDVVKNFQNLEIIQLNGTQIDKLDFLLSLKKLKYRRLR